MDYLYDGSFEGLLTAVYYSYYQEKADGIYLQDNYQFNLVSCAELVATDPELASKVYDAAENKISPTALRRIYYVYLSSHPAKENIILNYLRLGFRIGQKIDSYHTHPDVLPLMETYRKVSIEAHRLFGLLRFSDTGSYLYAELEPDHNILILLAEHFADRLAEEYFIIHDKKRHLAVVYNQKEWLLTDFPEKIAIPVTEAETYYRALWTKYFQEIGIESRANKKLQAHFVPQRYRKNLVEFRLSYPT